MSDVPASREVREEQFWRDGGGFKWIWPLFYTTRPADTKIRWGFNRYPHNIIGWSLVAFGRCWNVLWKASSPRKPCATRTRRRTRRPESRIGEVE